jgi:hypothetical protein
MTAKLLLVAVLGLALVPRSGTPARNPEPRPATAQSADPKTDLPPQIDFQTQIRPILESRCRPCHFEGGKMYQPLPFDRPETIHKLGDKMFTRIKDPKEQELLRAFLAAQ